MLHVETAMIYSILFSQPSSQACGPLASGQCLSAHWAKLRGQVVQFRSFCRFLSLNNPRHTTIYQPPQLVLNLYLLQTESSVSSKCWQGDIESEPGNSNSVCGLEISFSSVPQDIDIKLIPGNQYCNIINTGAYLHIHGTHHSHIFWKVSASLRFGTNSY